LNKTPYLFAILLFSLPIISTSFADDSEIKEFEDWANEHGINLVGVSKNSYDLYYDGYDSEIDYVDWKKVPGVINVAESLYKIPDNVIQVMDGKTIYFSTEYGRSYSVLGSFPQYDILVGLDRGIIIEQNINSYTVIHEIGHIVDYHGIKGIYDDPHSYFSNTAKLRDSIFEVHVDYQTGLSEPPIGHVSVYSTANDAENFAENFAHYVERPDEFRQSIYDDPQLIEEYEFMRDKIFDGLEY